MEELTLDALIAAIKGDDPKVRCAAWQQAGELGADAVKPLAKVMTDGDVEIARAAKRGLWVVVRHVGRPGAGREKRAVVAQLCDLVGADQDDPIRREALWMLSEIGDDNAIATIREIPDVLDNQNIREDARCAVQRIPTNAAIWALEDGLEAAPEEIKPALAAALRARGVRVAGYPTAKLKPTKQTEVEPVGR